MEAPRLLDEHPVDLLMLDVHMPQKDGLMLFEELKKRNRVLPVLFVTGYPGSFSLTSNRMSRIWTDYFGDGNADILYKPFTVDNLYEKVEMLIGPSEKSEA